ncbi:MAG: pyruvate dehydrogenase complex E1 component subunit beta [Elusimicrobiales bacterium]|nr:pyruvate dehydrogenase complex E1 component subunit beta [Elusimicrobiales bacterium]
MRIINYANAICEAHRQLLKSDPRVFIIGQGLWSPWYAGSSLKDLDKQFGKNRVIDTPVCENAVTAAAIGAAISGMRPIVFHPRMDFMLLAMDPIINQAANWSYMFAGKSNAPVVIRSVINRGGEQGAQHSQALQALLAHIPGLKVVMPATPYDAKGLLIAAVRDGNPVMYIDDRWLYEIEGAVPEEMYSVEIGKAAIRKKGKDVTIVAISYMAKLALEAGKALAKNGIDAEVIDLRSVKPWDADMVCSSVKKTGRLVVAEAAWKTCGVSADIAAVVSREAFDRLDAPVERVTLPETPAPASKALEAGYYPSATDIVKAAEKTISRRKNGLQSALR